LARDLFRLQAKLKMRSAKTAQNGRRMTEHAARLVDGILPYVPVMRREKDREGEGGGGELRA
jgi:hypothetical protein